MSDDYLNDLSERKFRDEKHEMAMDELRDELEAAQARIRELEAQNAELRDMVYNRAPKIAADVANRQQEELKAQLAEAHMNAYLAELGQEAAEGMESAVNAENKILKAQLAEAHAKIDELRKDWDIEISAKWQAQSRAEKAEADAARLRAALEMVEDYLCSEESPLYALWENGDICSWDDNPRERWSDVIDDMRNSKMSISDIGHGVEWQAVTVYRLVWAALADAHQPESEEAK